MKNRKRKNFMVGRVVRIPQALTVDSVRRQGYIGTIIAADHELYIIRVKFKDGTSGDYQFNCLETLYPVKALLYGLSLKNRGMDRSDYATIRKVITLAHQGKAEEALMLAYTDAKTEEFCITDTENFHGIMTNLRKHIGVSKRI